MTWAALVLVGLTNWQNIWTTAAGKPPVLEIEGSIGPSRLLISAPDLPPAGTSIFLRCGHDVARGIVVGRVNRGTDVWAQLFVDNPDHCDSIRRRGFAEIERTEDLDVGFLGAADVGSSDKSIRFLTTQALEVGRVIAVRDESNEILYQITGSQIEALTTKGGSQLVIRTEGTQLGILNGTTLRLERKRTVPRPGAAVLKPIATDPGENLMTPDNSILLGRVIGTDIPVFLDWRVASQGHLAILGMTRMGKTSLTVRIAEALAAQRRVVVLDQTGEYIGKRGLPQYNKEGSWSEPGLSVLEPRPQDVPPVFAHRFFKKVTDEAVLEYLGGQPPPRTIIVDEAHQFVPEPAGLGFGTPGRDEAIQFGLLMMQVRKYGIAVILVSQRTAVVAKSALSQCENLIAFKSVDQTGLDYLEAVAGAGIRNLLPQLQQGEALVFGPAVSSDSPVAIRVAFEEWAA